MSKISIAVDSIQKHLDAVKANTYVVRKTNTGVVVNLNLKDSDLAKGFGHTDALRAAIKSLAEAGVPVTEENYSASSRIPGSDKRAYWPCVYVNQETQASSKTVEEVKRTAALYNTVKDLPAEAALTLLNATSGAENAIKLYNMLSACPPEIREKAYKAWETMNNAPNASSEVIPVLAVVETKAEEVI